MKLFYRLPFFMLLSFCLIPAGFPQLTHAEKQFSKEALQDDFMLLKTALEEAHPATYWYTPKDSMDLYFARTYLQISENMTEQEFYRLLMPLLAKVQCGHTYAELSKSFYQNRASSPSYWPLELFIENERVYVLENLSSDSSIIAGDELISVNDISIRTIYEKARSIQSADGDNPHWKDLFIRWYLLDEVASNYFGVSPPYRFVLKNEAGHLRESEVYAFPYSPPGPDKRRYTKKQLKDKIRMENEKKTAEQFSYRFTAADTGMAYIKIKGFSYDDYSIIGYKKMHAELFSRIDSLNPEAIIIDLRGNSGGNLNLAENLMSYLVDKPFKVVDRTELQLESTQYLKLLQAYFEPRPKGRGFDMKIVKQTGPMSYEMKLSKQKYIEPAPKHRFRGKVAVITDGWVFSAASLLVSSLKSQRKIYHVGEETGGAAVGCSGGRISRLILPNTQIRVFFPHFRIYAVTDAKADGSGVKPEYPVIPSFEDKKLKRDVQLQKAFELLMP